jgi:transcriptional regulator with XRE-family HTH domain
MQLFTTNSHFGIANMQRVYYNERKKEGIKNKMTVGHRIKQRRKELKMSADELGSRLGVNRSTVFRYESGFIEKLPIDILEPIAKALQTTPAYLMGWEEVQKNNDILADIIVRLRTDEEFSEIVKILSNLDAEKLAGIKGMLITFLK